MNTPIAMIQPGSNSRIWVHPYRSEHEAFMKDKKPKPSAVFKAPPALPTPSVSLHSLHALTTFLAFANYNHMCETLLHFQSPPKSSSMKW